MLSDESSSDSETGRFKGRSEKKDDTKGSDRKSDLLGRRHTDRNRPYERSNRDNERERDRDRSRNERVNKDSIKERERQKYDGSRNKSRSSRYSPVRRRSRDRYHGRHSRDRQTEHRESTWRSKHRDKRSRSKELKSVKSPESKIDKEEKSQSTNSKHERSREPSSSSSDRKGKRSIVRKPIIESIPKRKVEGPVEIHDDIDSEEEVQPGSYYSMLPAVIKEKPEKLVTKHKDSEKSVEKDSKESEKSKAKDASEDEKSEESSEIDSSDDERLRAKLLNLEKELKRTRKKKHKKKHKKKSSKSNKDRDSDVTIVEVTSTTDIEEKGNVVMKSSEVQSKKENFEEGEITSDDNMKQSVDIDESDLRHRLKRSTKTSNEETEKSKTSEGVFGPALPPHLQKRFRSNSSEKEGPALPPNRNIGPAIPSDMRKALAEAEPVEVDDDTSEEDDGIGPLPEGSTKRSDAHQKLDERALDIKIKKIDGHTNQTTDIKAREQWMLELPAAKAKIIGIEARSFRAKQGPDMSDRSSWTDTPEEKARKAAGEAPKEDADEVLKREARERIIARRDDEQEESVKKHKKKHKRDESLLDMHQKKLKKKKKKEEKEEGKQERRPFSRDVDLQVNRFDEAQKKSIIKKAQQLDTRFSRGQAKYL